MDNDHWIVVNRYHKGISAIYDEIETGFQRPLMDRKGESVIRPFLIEISQKQGM